MIKSNEELCSKYSQQTNEKAKHLLELAIKDLEKVEFCANAESVQDNLDKLDRAYFSIQGLLKYQQRLLGLLSRDSE